MSPSATDSPAAQLDAVTTAFGERADRPEEFGYGSVTQVRELQISSEYKPYLAAAEWVPRLMEPFARPFARNQARQGPIGNCNDFVIYRWLAEERPERLSEIMQPRGTDCTRVSLPEVNSADPATSVYATVRDTTRRLDVAHELPFNIADVAATPDGGLHVRSGAQDLIGAHWRADWSTVLMLARAGEDLTWTPEQWQRHQAEWDQNLVVREKVGLPPLPAAAPRGIDRISSGRGRHDIVGGLAALANEDAVLATLRVGPHEGPERALRQVDKVLGRGLPCFVFTPAAIDEEFSARGFAAHHVIRITDIVGGRMAFDDPRGDHRKPEDLDAADLLRLFSARKADGNQEMGVITLASLLR